MEWSARYGNRQAGERAVRSVQQAREIADELNLNFANLWPRRIPEPLWKHQNEMLGSLRRDVTGKLVFIDAQ
jgi:hypothetical protein